MLDSYRRLAALRRERRLHQGGFESMEVHADEDGQWLVLDRGPVVVAINAGGEGADVPLGDGGPKDAVLSWGHMEVGDTIARLGPESLAVRA